MRERKGGREREREREKTMKFGKSEGRWERRREEEGGRERGRRVKIRRSGERESLPYTLHLICTVSLLPPQAVWSGSLL